MSLPADIHEQVGIRASFACEYCGVAPAVPNRAVRRDAARRGLPPTRVMDIDHMSWCPRSPTGYMPPSSAGGRRG